MGCRLDNLKAQRIAANYSISRLAAVSNTSDAIIVNLEAIGTNGVGGTTSPEICDRLAAALAVSRSTLGFVDLG